MGVVEPPGFGYDDQPRPAHALPVPKGHAMHCGRDYPYHPTYWATEAWFYRGFVPWKLYGQMYGEASPPWNIIPYGWSGISDPGYVDPDDQTINYEFAIDPPNAYPNMIVSLDLAIVGGVKKARWRASVGSGGSYWATAVLLQEFPQRVVHAHGFDYSLPAPPYTSALGPPLDLIPASYEDGGQPFEYLVGN